MPSKFKYFLQCIQNYKKCVQLSDSPKITIEDDTSLLFKPDLNTNQIVMEAVAPTRTTLNGYGLVENENYKLKEGDCIAINDSIVYMLMYKPNNINMKRPVTSTSDNDEEPARTPQIASIFNMEKKPKLSIEELIKGSWENINDELLIFTPEDIQAKEKIASFDLDGTLIKPKGGKTFPKDFKDWELFSREVPEKLKSVYEQDYKIVIFTNQSPLGKDPFKIAHFKEKVINILVVFKIPVQVFIAMKKTVYRKPSIGMWDTLLNNKNDGVIVDLSQSLYVGDAAGRPKGWNLRKKKDHSIADRLFALNVGLKFHTPEEFFLNGKPAEFEMPVFDPRELKSIDYTFTLGTEPEVIIMVGSPGSGKSAFCKNHLLNHGFVHVNRDKLGSWQNCLKLMHESLKNGKSVVIDNTNRDRETRKRYIEASKQLKVRVRCFVMNVDRQHAKHNNKYREITDQTHLVVSEIIINSHFKNFQEPSLNEGFEEIVPIEFSPMFDDEQHEKMYKRFLLEN